MKRSSSSGHSRVFTAIVAVIGIGVIAVVAIGFLITQNISSPITGARDSEPVFPDLAYEAETIKRIEIVGREQESTLRARNSGDWVLEEKNGYPALSGRVDSLLSDINEMRALERDQPGEREMADRGVADVDEGGEGLRVSFLTEDGDLVKEFVVGRQRSAPGATDLTAFYLRESGSDEVYLIDGALDMPADPMEWVDTTAFALDNQRIYEVKTAPREGEPVLVRRTTPGEAPFVPDGLPEGLELEGPWVLTELTVPFTAMVFDDVKEVPDEGEPSNDERGYGRTFDGVVLRYSFYPIEDDEGETEEWVRFEVDSAESKVREDVEGNGNDLPLEADVVPEGAATAEELEEKVAGWLFKLPDHTMTRLRQNIEGLPTRGVAGNSGVEDEDFDVEADEGFDVETDDEFEVDTDDEFDVDTDEDF